MRSAKVVSLLASVLLALSDANASEYDADTAKFWLDTCQEEGPSRTMCMAYIRGLYDMNLLFTVSAKRSWWCAPEGVTLDQIRLIVLDDLKKRPEHLHEPFVPQAALALRKAFPCSNTSPK
jgi:hypothetical protein